MGNRVPVLVVALLGLLFAAWLTLTRDAGPESGPRPPAPAGDPAVAPPPPTPEADLLSPGSVPLPVPEEVMSGEEVEDEPDPDESPAEALARLALRQIGPLFRELGDVEAFLDGAGSLEWKLHALPEAEKRRLLALLKVGTPEVRFQAALALSVAELDPADLAALRSRLDAELAEMTGEAQKNTVLALSFALKTHGDRHGVDRLADALRRGHGAEVEHFRDGAVLVLALTGDGESAPLLRDLLASDPDRLVRKHAVVGLGRIGGEENRGALVSALAREEDLEVRAWSALATGRATPPGEGDGTLLRALREDPDGEVRGAAAFGLSRTGGRGTVGELMDAWYADDHAFTRIGAVAGIARRGGGERARRFLEEEGSPWLQEALRTSKNGGARFYAARVLGSMPASEGRSAALRHSIANDGNDWVRHTAITSLVKTEKEAALPFLKERLAEEESRSLRDRLEREIRRLERQ